MEKRITVEEFVNTFKSFTTNEDREAYVKTILKRTYAPIIEKRVVLDTMITKSIVKDQNNTQFIDQLLVKVNLVLAVILLYTDLRCAYSSTNETHTGFDDYDALRESGAINCLSYLLGEAEMKELAQVQETLLQTFYNRHSSTEAFVNRTLAHLEMVFKSFENSGQPFLERMMKQIKTE